MVSIPGFYGNPTGSMMSSSFPNQSINQSMTILIHADMLSKFKSICIYKWYNFTITTRTTFPNWKLETLLFGKRNVTSLWKDFLFGSISTYFWPILESKSLRYGGWWVRSVWFNHKKLLHIITCSIQGQPEVWPYPLPFEESINILICLPAVQRHERSRHSINTQ